MTDAARLERRRAGLPVPRYPDLPVVAHRDAILDAIRAHQVVVVAGETGSGKSTQLPKLCLELGLGVKGLIGHTQPRRPPGGRTSTSAAPTSAASRRPSRPT